MVLYRYGTFAYLGFSLICCTQVEFNREITNSSNAVTAATIRSIEPALAVRGISCLMCHADIRANVVTDFGFGQNYFLGGSAHFDKDASWYNNLASAWQVSQSIVGQIHVPDVTVTPSAMAMLDPQLVGASPLKLKDFMNKPYLPNWNADGVNTAQAMTIKVIPPVNQEPVVSHDRITIRAPLEAEVKALAPELFKSENPGFVRIGSSKAVQLLVLKTPGGAYVTNDPSQPLDCEDADIIVKGPLFLRGLNVEAAKGCRIYTTGTVFIEDAIAYGLVADQSLQISSSRAIIMGINKSRLNNRMLVDYRGLELSAHNYLELANAVMTDANAVGVMRDAQDDYGGIRASIDYHGLLLNAPIVHSRYLGTIRGTIVAEAALFALGQFHFEFDPVLSRISVLPLLKKPILEAQSL